MGIATERFATPRFGRGDFHRPSATAKGVDYLPTSRSGDCSTGLANDLEDAVLESFGVELKVQNLIALGQVPPPRARTLYWSALQMANRISATCTELRSEDPLGWVTTADHCRSHLVSRLERSWSGEHPLVLASGREVSSARNRQRVTLRGPTSGTNIRITFVDARTTAILSSTRTTTTLFGL